MITRPAVLSLSLFAACAAPPETPKSAAKAEVPQLAAMPGPARGRLLAAVRQNAECEACHQDIAAEWRSSLHRSADEEPAYRRAFAIEPFPFCRACHAPEAIPAEPEPREVAALGVACVSCHMTEAPGVLAAPRKDAPEGSPHPLHRDARFAGPEACASCHEFAFPGAHIRSDAFLMQSTISEHSASPDAQKSCADCHMPLGASGKRSHVFKGSRDEAFVRGAIDVSAKRLSPTRISVLLSPKGVGHAFPTGDLFRRLEVAVEVLGADRMVLARAERYLGRHFVVKPVQSERKLEADDRIRDKALSVELDLGPEGEGRTLTWYVAYQRVAHPNGVDEKDALIQGEILLESGHLDP